MNRHQVLTGSANAGDRCFAVGSVEGAHFTAYGTGTTVVILASDFQRVQIIPSPLNGSDLEVSGISCCSDLGKIAASYGSKVCIFEPTPLSSHHASSHRLDYQWFHTGTIDIEGDILALKWNLDGSRLLTSGAVLEMWQNQEAGRGGHDERRPSFFIEDEDQFPADAPTEWTCVWKSHLANPVVDIKFSSDGLLFATTGENDRLVKIWYEDRKATPPLLLRSENSSSSDSHLSFSFIYLSHPRAVTGFGWRRTSKYLQKGSIANILLTSCKDNICRMWCETVLPEDGLLDTQQLEPKDPTSTMVAGQSKKRIVQRLYRIRHAFHKRKKFSTAQVQGSNSLIGALSVPDAQKFGGHNSELVPSFHFHLAASINLLTDVPLIGSLGNAKNETFDFVIHWLDNKEFHATLEAEKLIDELSHRSPLAEQDGVDPTMVNRISVTSPGRLGNVRKSGLPTIGSDPAINESHKKHGSTMQKTKSYISMFTGNKPTPSTVELPAEHETFKTDNSTEQLEHKVEQLMLSWHQGSDMLYGIHPLDGSLLMWVVDNLDESSVGTYGQVKASLSAMMPHTFPIFDALTMQPNVWLYCDFGRLGLKSLKLESELKFDSAPLKSRLGATGPSSSGRSDNFLIPNVLMVTKHTNGSLNMWQMSFADNSQFSTVVNVSHVSRASGHRFHTDSSACHPVLPLLLTTSHHETLVPSDSDHSFVSACSGDESQSSQSEACASELILWHVAPIGPLSKSGGIVELARINSPVALAFRSVAWFPTLLPVSTLGTVSNSPSALFVASDGTSLRIYQAVLDGRLILAEQQTKQLKPVLLRSNSNGSAAGDDFGFGLRAPGGAGVVDLWNIVSLQSTSRPGCIIDLKPIADAVQSWQNVQLIHVFQELLISGSKTTRHTSMHRSLSQVVDGNSRSSSDFEERFYLVVIEQMGQGESVLTMWRITIASQGDRCAYELEDNQDSSLQFCISVDKVYCEFLPLPTGVFVTMATVAAGHLSSSSIYPACFAPYLLSTACSDGRVRFWQCGLSVSDPAEYQWQEWRMMTTNNQGTSLIEVDGKVLSMSSAYSGRMAIAHRLAHKFDAQAPHPATSHFRGNRTESQAKAPSDRLVSLFVSVFECESTGGAKWTLEDTIEIPNVVIADPKVDIDLTLILDGDHKDATGRLPSVASTPAFHRTSSVPSFATVQSIRRMMSRTEASRARPCLKHRTHLDWVSTEDGSHVLTVSVGSRILLYTAVSVEPRPVHRRNGFRGRKPVEASFATMVTASEVRWVVLRSVELHTADGVAPLPKHITWVRNGILVVGMENEVHVYSQWKLPVEEDRDLVAEPDRSVVESDRSVITSRPSTAHVRTLSRTMSGIKLNASIANLSLLATKRARKSECSSVSRTACSRVESAYLPGAVDECGLFEAARMAAPCLPQYHPRQLLELLAFGRTRCVRLILSHLLRCLAGRTQGARATDGDDETKSVTLTIERSPSSAATSTGEDSEVSFLEVMSIPPLPLYVLLSDENADPSEAPGDGAANGVDYDGLFNGGPASEAASVGGSIESSTHSTSLDNRFGRAQARLLARYLEHTQLPEMSSLEQTNLLALADAMAKTTAEVDENDQRKRGLAKRELAEIIDDCGLRFLVAAQQHSSLIGALPDHQRAALVQQGLASAFFIWAFHSKSKQELLESLPWKQKDDVTWDELRQFGVGWWLTDIEILTHWIEKVAKTSFQVDKDPMDVALFYIAMRKKNVLCGLFKMQNDSTKVKFFKNNFSEERWRKAALKNAFHLLGRQRFQHAASFFLLAGAVTDALQVCLTHLRDFQLALVIIRLYEGGSLDGVSAGCRRLLSTEILGSDDSPRSHDPFLRSMAYWLLDDHRSALETLLSGDDHGKDSISHEDLPNWKDFGGARASVFNVYRYLRSHALVVEKKLLRVKGFSGGETSDLDGITPVERQLYFQTAHVYFRAGCPLLALEVLTNLPRLISEGGVAGEELAAVASGGEASTADIVGGLEKPGAVGQSSLDFDWSQPVVRIEEDELDLSLGTSSESEEDEETVAAVDQNQGTSVGNALNQGTNVGDARNQGTIVCDARNQDAGVTDLMAQQLNFIACVKILVNELSTLATGFEVDGGQLRFQLYVWLEKEMEVLRRLCYAGDDDESESDRATDEDEAEADVVSQKSGSDVAGRALHETILAEKTDFEAKLHRMARRSKWLRAHEQVLSTLLGYSVLHATSSSGLASMQMELLLLLQELQQTKMPQQLRWPIPYPTTLPLLAASIASAKTVVADPIRHLQGMCQDLLHTLIEFKTAPATDVATSKVCLLRDLSIALSSCVYQCLFDSDSFVVSTADDADVGLEGFTSAHVPHRDSHLMAGARRRPPPAGPSDPVEAPTSLPASWPGVSSLVTLMNQKCDEDGPQLRVLLMEALVAVFMSLVCYALSVYDAIVLYRLVAHPLHEAIWPLLFGGGLKKPIRVAVSNDLKTTNVRPDHNANIRSRLHRHVFGPLGLNSFASDDRSMYQEQFVPPQMNMIGYFLAKVNKSDNAGVDYDSADSVNSEDDEDDDEDDDVDIPNVDELKDDYNEDVVFPTPKTGENRLREHVDPNSYSWCLMRYAIIKYVGQTLRAFLPKIGMDLAELPTRSPLVQSVKKNVEVWEGQLRAQMEAFPGPPKGYIPGCSVDSSLGVNIVKYSALTNPDNTPFLSTHYSALPAKRLWNYLVTRDGLQDVFIHYVFGKGRSLAEMNSSEPFFNSGSETMKVIYKDQEAINSFAILPSNSDCVVVATQRELIELNISQMLSPLLPPGGRNSNRWDNIEVIRNSSEALDSLDDNTVIIQPSKATSRSYALEIPLRRAFAMSSSSPPVNNGLTPSSVVGHGGQVVLKRPLSGVRKIGAHPQLPYYLTGMQDGSLRLWELGRQEVVGEPRRTNGSLPKLTRVLFNSQGNKFGVSDVDGSVCLWQLGHNLNLGLPFMEMKCHNKGTNDFVFVGSSSLFATAGHSSDNFNVCLWDTLLPKYKALVKGFHCYSDGCSALVYAPCHQAIIAGGKKGELYIFDVRQQQLRHTFQAHQTAIKCISFDPTEDSFATGSADGEVKVWGLTIHNLLYTFSSERSRSSRFRSSGTAISELYLGPNGRLFSSSTDGTLKLRQLTYKHSVVNSWQGDGQADVTHF